MTTNGTPAPVTAGDAPPRTALVEWDLVDAITIVCLDAGIIGVASLLGSLVDPSYARLVAGVARICILVPAVLLITRRMWGVVPAELGIIGPVDGSLGFFVKFSAALAVAYAVLGAALYGLAGAFFPDAFADPQRLVELQSRASAVFLRGAAGAVSFAVLGLVSAPLCEELVFRGILYPTLRSSYGRAVAVVASAAIFAAAHLVWHGKLFAPVTQFLGGLIFAWSYEKTRSLLYPVVFHAIGNLAILIWNLVFAYRPAWVSGLLL